MTTKDMSWEAEKRLDERYYYSIANIHGRVLDVPPSSREIGYTSSDRNIYLAKECEITEGMEEKFKKLFRLGVFVHELLHQLFTDFIYMNNVLSRYSRKELTVLQTLINLIEDPAIEYHADHAIGGALLQALRYTILTIYKWSPTIDTSSSPWSEFLNALIQFGDTGIVKGDFTSQESFKAFRIVAPSFYEMVADPVSSHRIDAAVKWMDETRFLWEEESAEDLKDAAKEVEKNMGSPMPEGGGRQKSFPPEGKKETEAEKNREKALNKLEDEESEEPAPDSKKPSTGQSGASDGKPKAGQESDEEVNVSGVGEDASDGQSAAKGETAGSSESGDHASETDTGEGSVPSGGPSANGSGKSGSSAGHGGESSDEEGDEELFFGGSPAKEADSNPKESKEGSGYGSKSAGGVDEGCDGPEDEELNFGRNPARKAPGKKLGTPLGTDPAKADEGADKAVTFDPFAADTITDEVAKEEKVLERKAREEMLHAEECSALYGKITVHDEPVSYDRAAEEEYKEICRKYGRDINLLTASLKQILSTDIDTYVRSLSGRYNTKRALTRSTVKIFDKRREAKNIADIAVMLVIDESGSMYGGKIQTAKETAIIISETLYRLSIPCYIMGFTADYRDYTAYHEHFVRWKNTPKERISLAGMSAKANNFDGFSIRHASLILKKKRAEHKIMFIISDGLPACSRYHGRGGIEDTAKAIREAGHSGGVIGIGVGQDVSDNKDIFDTMYGRTPFIPVADPEELKTTLTAALKAVIRKI